MELQEAGINIDASIAAGQTVIDGVKPFSWDDQPEVWFTQSRAPGPSAGPSRPPLAAQDPAHRCDRCYS
jgi:hypothetical protein